MLRMCFAYKFSIARFWGDYKREVRKNRARQVTFSGIWKALFFGEGNLLTHPDFLKRGWTKGQLPRRNLIAGSHRFRYGKNTKKTQKKPRKKGIKTLLQIWENIFRFCIDYAFFISYNVSV